MDDLVVGLDGSAESTTALRWAAAALAPDGCLQAVHALAPTGELAFDAALGDSVALRHQVERELAETWLAPIAGHDVHVRPTVVEDSVATGLIALADEVDADGIVVGHHPEARFGPQVVGHVTADLLRHSDRPVIVVPRDWDPALAEVLPVAVGVGVSEPTRVAIRWAMSRAGATGSGLLLVHALGHRSLFRTDGLFDVLAYHLDPKVIPEWVEDDLAALALEIQEQTGEQVEMTLSVDPGRIGARLVEAGERARLLVIGRGEPPFLRRRVMAPYLRHAIAHAPCPVAVVPVDEGT
jgi:nucleotide-binding universal stress UspA family protein